MKEKKSFWGVVTVASFLAAVGVLVLFGIVLLFCNLFPGHFAGVLVEIMYNCFWWIIGPLAVVFAISMAFREDEIKTAIRKGRQ